LRLQTLRRAEAAAQVLKAATAYLALLPATAEQGVFQQSLG
jgi:hypothetical protein